MNYSRYHRNDWKCSSCNTIIYGNLSKIVCICGQTKTNSKQIAKCRNKYQWRIGDKLCSNCNNWNFKSNKKCNSCNIDL